MNSSAKFWIWMGVLLVTQFLVRRYFLVDKDWSRLLIFGVAVAFVLALQALWARRRG